jgi:hypothetical protein
MEKYEKIAESLANGRLYVTPNIFDNDDWDFKNSLFSNQDTTEWYMLKLALAEYHLQRGNEDDAFEIYKSILKDVVINNHIDDKYHDIAYKAYKGLSKVTWNGRDYIWESGISIIDDYKQLFGI